ncbi:MAG TPA: hypothetical protein VMW48_11440 [Vicinamibacterales bacterium]|nr:hypothetical protein [Vicinamibacterales bacterium]
MTTRREFVVGASHGVAGLGLAGLLPLQACAPRVPGAVGATGTGFVYDARSLAHVVPPSSSGAPRPEVAERLVRIMEVLKTRGLVDEMRPLSALGDPRPYIEAHHAGR